MGHRAIHSATDPRLAGPSSSSTGSGPTDSRGLSSVDPFSGVRPNSGLTPSPPRVIALFVAALVAVACVDTGQNVRPFNLADYEPYRAGSQATGSVSGQAFMKTRGGEVRYAAGNAVILEPATGHSEDVVISLVRRHPVPPERPEIREFQKTTIADADGRFRFSDLQAGDYLVRTLVVWEYSDRWGSHSTGGWIFNRVTVRPGQDSPVVVTTNHL